MTMISKKGIKIGYISFTQKLLNIVTINIFFLYSLLYALVGNLGEKYGAINTVSVAFLFGILVIMWYTVKDADKFSY